jgi:hypothetical protein
MSRLWHADESSFSRSDYQGNHPRVQSLSGFRAEAAVR